MEAGYAIHTFAGVELYKAALDKLKQVLWRPRPPTLLTRADHKKIRRNLRDYSRVFEEADAAEESNVSKELTEHRQRLVDEWNAWRSRCKAQLAEEREELGRKPPAKMVLVPEGAKRKAGAAAQESGQDLEQVEEWVEEGALRFLALNVHIYANVATQQSWKRSKRSSRATRFGLRSVTGWICIAFPFRAALSRFGQSDLVATLLWTQ